MSLNPGTAFGPYQIIDAIGAGGMGEVYRARDPKLGRDVAIKVLPDALASDHDRQARFEREARTLASLNHPHIAAIHGFEKSGGMQALVMELVEGDDLSQRIARGPMPLDEVVPVARQIADALEAAHEQGIIHRDLKPANIKVRPDGTVKVLDFGLAKGMDQGSGIGDQGSGGAAQSLTVTSPAMTMRGVILGTAAYMSPEQAKGKPVDRRADIWAFGCVLYEMLTGTRVFAGESVAETMGLLFSREPDMAALPAATPAHIRTLVARCLIKDPRQRLRDIGEARLALDAAFETTAPHALVSPTSAAPRGRLAWIVATVALLVAAALAFPVVWHLRETAAAVPGLIRLELMTPPTTDPLSLALSPDGRQIAFVASGETGPRLWVRRFDQPSATALPGTDGAAYPFWEPQGRAVGFFAAGKLLRIDVASGAPQVLAEAPSGRGGTWSADGVVLFAPSASSGLRRVAAAGGPSVGVTELLAGEVSHRWPQFLPDGEHFLFSVALGRPDTRGTFVGALAGGPPTRVLPDDMAAVFAPPDRLLVLRQGVLMALGFDTVRAIASGDQVPVAQSVGADTAIARGAFSVSATGVLAHLPVTSARRQLTWVDRAGRPLGTVGSPNDGAMANPALAPDGQRVTLQLSVQGNSDVWLLDPRGVPSRFTFDAAIDTGPVWSPDGRRVVFRSGRNGVNDLFEKPANGAADEQPLLVTPQNKAPQDWSPDGRTLLYAVLDPKTGTDLWALPFDGDKKPYPVLQTAFDEMDAQFSPDGRWIAYESNQSGRLEILVRAFPESRGQWQVSTMGGSQPRWRADGKELFYVAPDGRLMATPIATTADGLALAPGAAAALFPARLASGTSVTVGSYSGRPQYAVARDGRFLMNLAVDADATPPVSIVFNWPAALTTRAPTP